MSSSLIANNLWGAAGHDRPPPAADFEQAFVAQGLERSQHGVDVDIESRSELAGWGQSFAGGGITRCNGRSQLCTDLLVQWHSTRRINPEQHCSTITRTTSMSTRSH